MSAQISNPKIECIELLLQRCMSKEQKWIAKLSSIFQSNAVISQDCLKNIDEKTMDATQVKEWIHEICIEIQAAKQISRHLIEACESEEFPGDGRVAKLMKEIVECTDSDAERYLWILKTWDKLMTYRVEISNAVDAKWLDLWQISEGNPNDEEDEQLILLLTRMSGAGQQSSAKFVGSLQKIVETTQGEKGDDISAKEKEESTESADSDDEEWCSDSWDFLLGSLDILKMKVESLWGDRTELVDPAKWPTPLFEKFQENVEGRKLKEFTTYAKELKKELEETRKWFINNHNGLKTNKELIIPLVEKYWPGDTKLLKSWPSRVVTRCQDIKESAKVEQFAAEVKRIVGGSNSGDTQRNDENEERFVDAKDVVDVLEPQSSNDPFTVINPEDASEYSISLDWLEEHRAKLKARQHRLYPKIDALFPNDKRVANDPDFPVLLVDRLMKEVDHSSVIEVIQKIKNIVEEDALSQPIPVQRQLPTASDGSPVDKPDVLADRLSGRRDAHLVEFRVISLPTPVQQMQISIGNEIMNMKKKQGSQYFSYQYRMIPEATVGFYFVSNLEKDTEDSREYTAPGTKGRTTRFQYYAAWFGDQVTCYLHKSLPQVQRNPNFDERRFVEDIMGWIVAMRKLFKVEAIEETLMPWTTGILDNCKSTLKVLTACAIVAARNSADFPDTPNHNLTSTIFRLLRAKATNVDILEKVAENFPDEPGGSGFTFKDLTEQIERLFYGSQTKDFLLALPFYWQLCNAGKPVDVRTKQSREKQFYLPGSNTKAWEKKAANWSQGDILSLRYHIVELSKTDPWILKPFLYFLKEKCLLSFFQSMNYSLNKLSIDFLLMKLHDALKSVEQNDLEKLLKMLRNAVNQQECDGYLAKREDIILEALLQLQKILNILKPSVSSNYGISSWTRNYVAIFCARTAKTLNDIHLAMDETVKRSDQTTKVGNNHDGIIAFINEYISVAENVASFDQVKFWSALLAIEWNENSISTEFRQRMEKVIETKSSDSEKSFIDFYIEHVDNEGWDRTLKSIYEQVAVKCFTGYLQAKKKEDAKVWKELTRSFLGQKQKKLMKFFGRCLQDQFKEMDGLKILFEWDHAVEVVDTLYQNAEFAKSQPEVSNVLGQRVDSFKALVEGTCSQSIRYREFKLLEMKQDRCIELWKACQKAPPARKASAAPLDELEQLNGELANWKTAIEEYLSTKKHVGDFMHDCEDISDFVDLNFKELNDKIRTDINDKNILSIRTIFRTLSDNDEIMRVLKRNKLMRGNTFYRNQRRSLAKTISKSSKMPKAIINWKDIILKIFAPALVQVQEAAERIVDGTLPIKKIPEMFERKESEISIATYVNKQLKQFYNVIEPDLQNMERREEEIIRYHSIETAMSAIDCLHQIKDALKLHDRSNSIGEYDEDWLQKDLNHMPKIQSDMKEFMAEDVEIMKAFLKQKDLVDWLMKETKSIKDIVTLGELAKLSARGDREMDKIYALRSAVAGFSPLIYDLRNDHNDTKNLTKKCFEVFKHCKEDQRLLEKWEIAGSHVGRIKETVKIYGQSGKHSMEIVQDINDRGMYFIKRMDGKLPGLNNYIRLELDNENCWQHSNLRDLQSQVMLISGEHDKDEARQVDIFVELLTAVENLAQVCMDLSKAGCLLFEDLEITICKRMPDSSHACESKQHPEFTITFSLNKRAKQLTGVGDFTVLQEIIGNLKKILSRWTEYTNAAYAEHYYLNEYSNDQITYLCKELGTSGIKELSDQAVMLLAKIRSNVSLREINSLLREATKAPAKAPRHGVDNEESKETEEDAMIKAVRYLHYQRGIEENLAKAAVAASGTNIEECMLWTYLNRDDDKIKEFLGIFQAKTAARYQGRNIRANFEVLHARLNQNLNDIIMNLQQSQRGGPATSIMTLYEAFVEETGSVTMDGLLNLGHFGKFLTLLGEKRDPNSLPNRAISGLKYSRGKTNVMICDESDIPAVTLNLYARENNNPLPTTSEVLLCQESTTEDEVKRFMRRALFKCATNGSPIFCLANAHKLRHRVSESAGNLFHELTKGEINRDFQLVIISSDRRHFLSTCFDQEPQESPYGLTKTDKLGAYLEPKLKGNIPPKVHSSTVKIVYSHRSGLGKSLHIKRLEEKVARSSMRALFHFRTIRYMEKVVNPDVFIDEVTNKDSVRNEDHHFIKLDMTPAIEEGLFNFAFNLLILGSIENSTGKIWRRNRNHLYLIEMTQFETKNMEIETMSKTIEFLKVLPNVRCLSPEEILEGSKEGSNEIVMDEEELSSERFQRPSQYLKKLDDDPKLLGKFKYGTTSTSPLTQEECIQNLLKHCSVKNPSWSQLRHFSSFLNMQLTNCERSTLFKEKSMEEFAGLKYFAIRFTIKMAQDFSTPSVNIEDMNAGDANVDQETDSRRTWEKQNTLEKHPFIFFNNDGASMTSIDVKSNAEGDIVDLFGKVLIPKAFPGWCDRLPDVLKEKGVAIDERFDDLSRKEKLRVLCKVMGLPVKERATSGNWRECLESIDDSGYITFKHPTKWLKTKSVRVVSLDHLKILKHCKQYGLVHGNKFEDLEKMLQEIVENIEKDVTLSKQHKLGIRPTEVFPDPDPTYELSTNNVLKILAIHTRFLCNIPVIIMGETGCGKTRMIKFMSDLWKGTTVRENLMTLRVHGGITVNDIRTHINRVHQKAGACLKRRVRNEEWPVGHKPRTEIFLFFDEANTTEAIYAIKEAMCDGNASCEENNIWIVAACNPYKNLSEPAIKKLTEAGLGYRVQSKKEKPGFTPMHTLVYRVIALPPSMQPFVWDFGQLGDSEEKLYVKQMVIKLGKELNLVDDLQLFITDIFSYTHSFMRKQDEECKYVSLRDVERCITAYKWFHNNASWLCGEIENISKKKFPERIHIVLQVLGICYHASLEDRKTFREEIATFFRKRVPNQEDFTESHFLEELQACQTFIVSHMDMGENIAVNEALRENVYMIAICAEMKIPLFLVGKPGSSKSLAKTIVAGNLLGDSSKETVCKRFKEIGMTSFQCSALTQAAGIEKVFKQCARYQEEENKENPDKYVSVVALDEIGLAEDSPHMPLKILHALLESGSVIDDDLRNKNNPSKKVGFLGISNWALDPAKLNRGIFVTRGSPDGAELAETTRGIIGEFRDDIMSELDPIIRSLIDSYLSVRKKSESEFFGLRDLYSMIKQIKTSVLEKAGRYPILTMNDAMKAVVTNFSGGQESHLETFKKALIKCNRFQDECFVLPSIYGILERNLGSRDRHLLLMTKQHFSLDLLIYALDKVQDKVQVIYGSAFPGDNNDTALCRYVNKIKVCMETDCIAIIVNLRKIHESLYDALNQHYVTLGENKYVDLGFGSSEDRIKCRVHDNFRVIFLEDCSIVYEEYPAPLINRLEKHHFDSEMLLTSNQLENAEALKKWTNQFSCMTTSNKHSFREFNTLIGYHNYFVNAVILALARGREDDRNGHDVVEKQSSLVTDSQKYMILQCATIDSIIRLQNSKLVSESESLRKVYFQDQKHENLLQFLRDKQNAGNDAKKIFLVTTFSTVLMENDRHELEKSLFPQSTGHVVLLSLLSYETTHQFSENLDDFFKTQSKQILLIQCNSAEKHLDRIACARHTMVGKLAEYTENVGAKKKIAIAFLLSTSRSMSSSEQLLVLQNTLNEEIIYIDELRPVNAIGPIGNYLYSPLGDIFHESLNSYTTASVDSDRLDILSLLKRTLCEALSPLKSSGARSEQLVSILSSKLEDRDFASILLKKVVLLVKERDRAMEGQETKWIIDKACNYARLVDAGTFQNVIWLHLKDHLAAFLGYITSVIDANSNLNLASTESGRQSCWSVKLWMSMFDRVQFSWTAMRSNKSYTVETPVVTEDLYKFRFPFSSLLYNEIARAWDGIASGGEEYFMTSLKEGTLMSPVEEYYKSEGDEVLNILLDDLTRIIYIPKSHNAASELEAMMSIAKKWSVHSRKAPENCDEGNDGLSQAVTKFMRLQKNFSYFSGTFAKWPDLASTSTSWVENSKCEDDILQSCFHSVVDILTKTMSSIGEVNQCFKWMDEVQYAAKLFGSFSETTTLKSDRWRPISLVYLLLTQLVPLDLSNKEEKKDYIKVVAKEAASVGHLFVKMPDGISNEVGLRVVCQVLANCYEEVKLRLLINWTDAECGICNKLMKDPRRLKCGHYLCKTCSQTSSICPTCSERFDRGDCNENLTLSSEKVRELGDFKLKCSSFIVNYITSFVKGEKALKLILEELFVPGLATSSGKNTLNSSAIDQNMMTRTCLLKHLLEYYEGETTKYINQNITVKFTKCARDAILAILLHFESLCKLDIPLDSLKLAIDQIKKCDKTTLEMLEHVAELRCGLRGIANKIHEDMKRTGNIEKATVINLAELFQCDRTNALRTYFVKYFCVKIGLKWLTKLSTDPLAVKLIPDDIAKYLHVPDLWNMLGSKYSKVISSLSGGHSQPAGRAGLGSHNNKLEQIIPTLESFSMAMTDQEKERMVIRKFQQPSSDPLVSDMMTILEIFRSDYVLRNPVDRPLMQLLFMVAIAVKKQRYLMKDFKLLEKGPEEIRRLFLPSMPQSLYFSVPSEYRTEHENAYRDMVTNIFSCPNGHMYVIDNCTRPRERGKCPACNEGIGGVGEVLDPGNARVVVDQASQAGYILNENGPPRQYMDSPDDRLSEHGVLVTRFILHSYLLLAAYKNKKPTPSLETDPDYLLNQMRQHIDDLGRSLSTSPEEAQIILYKIMKHVIETKVSPRHPESVPCDWTSIDSRRLWEIEFREVFLLPIFANWRGVVADGWNMLMGYGPLGRLMRDLPLEQSGERKEEVRSHPTLWSTLEHPNISSLLQDVQDNPQSRTGKILKAILKQPYLALTRFLMPVLRLQSILIKKYQYNLEPSEAKEKSFSQFLLEEKNDSALEKLIENYFDAWKKTQEYKWLGDPCAKLTMESSISYALPRKPQPGSLPKRFDSAKLLLETLMKLHNEFLQECADVNPELSPERVSVSDLRDSHICHIDMKNDLLNLIAIHTKYDVQYDEFKGATHEMSYDVVALESLVLEMYVRHKKLIKIETIPCIQYSLDIGISEDWPALSKLIPQKPLPDGLEKIVDARILNNEADLYEGVRTLSHVISFLAKTSPSPSTHEESLKDYMIRILKLDSKRLAVIPTPVQIKHTLALYSHLTWRKAVAFVRQGIDPYKDLLHQGQQEISDDLRELTEAAFKDTNVTKLQRRINEILITKLDLDLNWKLEDIFPNVSYLDKVDDDEAWCKNLPKDLQFAHMSNLFEMTVHFIDGENDSPHDEMI